MRRWEEIYTDEERAVGQSRGNKKQDFGKKPALLIIDVNRRCLGTREADLQAIRKYQSALWAAGWAALPNIQRLLETCRELAGLAGSEETLEALREKLAEGFQTEGGVLPEFCWEKGAAVLLFSKVKRTGLEALAPIEDTLAVHINDVYDDCARTVQLGLWIMASAWRAEVVDTWLFESAYAFFHHTIPHHLAGSQGLVALIPRIVGELQSA